MRALVRGLDAELDHVLRQADDAAGAARHAVVGLGVRDPLAALRPGRVAPRHLAQEVLDAVRPAQPGGVHHQQRQRLQHHVQEDPLAQPQVDHLLRRLLVRARPLVRHEALEEGRRFHGVAVVRLHERHVDLVGRQLLGPLLGLLLFRKAPEAASRIRQARQERHVVWDGRLDGGMAAIELAQQLPEVVDRRLRREHLVVRCAVDRAGRERGPVDQHVVQVAEVLEELLKQDAI